MADATPDVLLLPLDAAALAAASENPAEWARGHGVHVGEAAGLVQELARQTREFRERIGATVEWGSFFAADAGSREVIGTCAFKGPPESGAVEIAYFTFPAWERRGYATAMAGALARRAGDAPEVRLVRAHTLPERNASVRVLEKVGFAFRGEVVDPEDGPVWRWEREIAGRA